MRAITLSFIALVGCVDGFKGSNAQFDFSPATPVQASQGVMPRAGELPSNVHFTFYAFQLDPSSNVGRLFEVTTFEIHRIVDLSSPCFIDVGDHVPHPGLHVSQYAAVIAADTGITDLANPPAGATMEQKVEAATAVQRMMNVAALGSDAGIKVVTSASTAMYPALAGACVDSSGIPPPMCTDDTSNKIRLQKCQDFWKANPDYYEGTDRVLTQPLNGTAHGLVDGQNPINLAPVGGAQFFVDSELDGFDGYAIYENDDAKTDTGNLVLFGTPTMPTRGVIHVHMTDEQSPMVTADVAIFANLDEDQTSF